jgi:hypothetical protein
MSSRKPSEQIWEGFSNAAIPPDASKGQRIEMRKSFFAGAHSLFGLLRAVANAGEDEPTNAEMQLMNDVQEELNDFVEAQRNQIN